MSVETMTETTKPRANWPATLNEAFQQTAARYPDRVALATYGSSEEITWREYGERVRAVAAGLAGLGIRRGDTVAMMLTNRSEAFIVDTAALHLGATPFSVYNTSSTVQLEYFFAHAGARVVVTEAQFADRIPAGVEHVFVVDGARDLAALGAAAAEDFDFDATWRAVTPDDLAVLIYTSGTTGPPKGVELTHANILAQRRMIEEAYDGLREPGRSISFLPMAHLADRFIALYPGMLTGSTSVCFTDAKQAIAALPEVRPTFLATVPRIWEKFKAALEAGIDAEPDERKRDAVRAAIDAGIRKVRLEMAGEPVPAALAEACRRADAPVFAALRERLGLDQAVVVMSGAAPIAGEVLEFFAAIGLPVCEVWGMSESCSTVTCNPKHAIRIGTVGIPHPSLELKLADDGELLVRGPSVMRGYRNDPEQTAEAIDADGWLHTGDIGAIDDDGYVTIVDRKKELIINAAGKNMSPANIENHLRAATGLIGPAIAIGDRRPYNTALITLDPDAAAARGSNVAALAADPRVQAEVAAAVEHANGHLSRVEQIKRFTILAVAWLPDSEELTATMKLRRRVIAEKYAAEIDALYDRR
jgi:long-subunit acyl-CoA synthetase (AMP-forming)